MKRPICLGLILLASLCASSCAEKDARQYARKLAELLSSYSRQIDAKLADEEARYISEAKRDEEAVSRDAARELRDERIARAQDAARQLTAGSVKPAALLETIMPAYAKKDFDQNEALYTKTQDSYTSHLKNITHLSIEKAKIQALQQALEALGRQPNLMDQLQEFSKFAADLKDQVNLQACSAALDTIAARQLLVQSLTTAINDPAKAAEKATNQKKLDIAAADLKAAQTLRDASGKFKGSTCQ
jgi:hypothetical protein